MLKRMTSSTNSREASARARPRSSFTGRFSPFRRRTEASVLRPTISFVPKEAALARYSMWPRCMMSKHPLVNTTFSLRNFHMFRRREAFSADRAIFFSM